MTTVSPPAPTQSNADAETIPVALPEEHQPHRLRPLMRRYSGPRDMDGQLRLAANLAKARIAIPRMYRDNSSDLLALMQVAISLDIELPVAWDNIHFNEEGVGGMRARLMHALVIRAGHQLTPVHVDEKLVRMHLQRTDGGVSGSAKWSRAEAVGAHLFDKTRSPWQPYPVDMLWARCTSRVCRRYAPDVILGFYEIGELDDIPTDDAMDPVDLSTVMHDVDGNLVPAPDVVALLTDLDVAPLAVIQNRWRLADEEGLKGAYAGNIDGVDHTVEEILYTAGLKAKAREEAEQGKQPDAERAAQQLAAAAASVTAVAPSVLDEPAGTGDRLLCGCRPAAVMAGGKHEEGCTR